MTGFTRRQALAASGVLALTVIGCGGDDDQPDTTNASDGIYAQGGEQSTVKVEKSGDGYVGRLTMGVAT